MKNNFIKNVSKVFFSNVLTIVSGIIMSFTLPMLISLKDFGYYKIFTLYASYIGCLALGIIDGINLKYAGTDIEKLNKNDFRLYFKVLSFLQLFFSILLIFFSIIFLNGHMRIIIIICSVFIFPNNMSGYFQQLSQVSQNFNAYAIRDTVKSIGNIVILLILFILLKFNYNVSDVYYLILFFLINILLFFWYMLIYKDFVFGSYTNFKLKKDTILSFIKLGFPLMISNLCSTLILTIDRQFVSVLFSKEKYAIYAFAYSLLSLVTIAIGAISVVLFPMLKQKKIMILSKNYNHYVSIISILVSFILLSYFPIQWLIPIILPKYNNSLLFFKIMFPTLIGSSVLTVIMHNYYKALNKSSLFFRKSIIILFLALIANFIAYYFFRSMVAFSVASVIVNIVWYIYTEQTLIKEMSVKWKNNFFYQIIIMLDFYLIVFFISNNFIAFVLYLFSFAIITIIIQKNIIKIYGEQIRNYLHIN